MSQIKSKAAFSLVEVVLAMGVVAFSFLSIFALLPAGMGLFRRAMETSVSAEIVQRIVSDAEQTDFDSLIGNAANGAYYALPIRYFDDQGSEVKVLNAAAPTPAELIKILYWVRVRGSLPGNPDPSTHDASYFTSLPSTGVQRFNPRASTYLAIQIVNNPASVALSSLLNASYLIDSTKATAAHVSLQTFSVVVSRNGYSKAP